MSNYVMEIKYDNPEAVYYPGQTVRGQLIMKIKFRLICAFST